MEGFLNPMKKLGEKTDKFGNIVPILVRPVEQNERMKKAGFEIDEDNEVYIREGYGAYMQNVPPEINTIEDLRSYEIQLKELPEIHLTDIYKDLFIMIDEEGYEFVLGPGAPGEHEIVYGKGLYCVNYKEIIEKQKAKKQEIKKDEGMDEKEI